MKSKPQRKAPLLLGLLGRTSAFAPSAPTVTSFRERGAARGSTPPPRPLHRLSFENENFSGAVHGTTTEAVAAIVTLPEVPEVLPVAAMLPMKVKDDEKILRESDGGDEAPAQQLVRLPPPSEGIVSSDLLEEVSKLIMPKASSTTTTTTTTKETTMETGTTTTTLQWKGLVERFVGWGNRLWTSMGLRLPLRPGAKFRFQLALTAGMAFVLSGSLLTSEGTARLIALARNWLAQRGFQGIAALGRSVTYGWALFVAYPRLLDRRAGEGRLRDRERKLERRRSYLRSLAGEMTRSRQELSTIDSEMRSFRREIIAMKACAQDDNPEVKEAIAKEMGHLARLRSDAQEALSAARKAWAEARSESPLEDWDYYELTE